MGKQENIGGAGKNPTSNAIAGMKTEKGTSASAVKVSDRILSLAGGSYSRMQPTGGLSGKAGLDIWQRAMVVYTEPLLKEWFAGGNQYRSVGRRSRIWMSAGRLRKSWWKD